jgi:hypothetical protein
VVTQVQVNRWRGLIQSGDRTQFYLEYFMETGSDQILEMASISTFSGAIGGAALFANFAAKEALGGDYIPIERFSETMSSSALNAIEADLAAGGDGRLSDMEFLLAARDGWIHLGDELGRPLEDFFPGHAEILKEAVLSFNSGDSILN